MPTTISDATMILRLRNDLQLPDDTVVADSVIQDWITRAKELHTISLVIFYKARLIGAETLLAAAVKDVDYVANESEEKANQRFIHLVALREMWIEEYNDAASIYEGGFPGAIMNLKSKPSFQYDNPSS